MVNFRCLFLKKVYRSSSRRLKIATFVILFIILYVFGVFTHLFEKNLSEFKTPLTKGVRESLRDLRPGQSIDQIPDINNLIDNFIHNAKNSCYPIRKHFNQETLTTSPYLVILVKSKLTNFEARNTIRNTWAQKDEFNLIRTVFLIGYPDLNNVQEANELLVKINNENLIHQDIVQQNFFDTYYNNTLKTMMGIKWINRYCSHSKFYMFIDDDFYLNPKKLMNYLKTEITESKYENLFGGYVFPSSRPMRHINSKWYITLQEYPYHKFPPFVAAGCYIISQKSAQLFYTASRLIKIFRFDDIYMAILALNTGIKPMHIEQINYYAPKYEPSLYASDVIAAHDFKGDQLIKIWEELKELIKFNSENLNVYRNYLHDVITKD